MKVLWFAALSLATGLSIESTVANAIGPIPFDRPYEALAPVSRVK